MKVYFAADHAGFELKEHLIPFVRDTLGHEVEDCGAFTFEEGDDYPMLIAAAARHLALDPERGVESRAILLGGSGQGEAMAANRIPGVRCAVYYGNPGTIQTDADGTSRDIVTSSRAHNDANALALGARFITLEEAREVIKIWLETEFSGDERHERRNAQLDALPE